LNGIEKNPLLKKGDRGGFDFEFSRCHRVEFLNELRKHHISSLVKNPVWQMLKNFRFQAALNDLNRLNVLNELNS
jgi:hypothetical protein